MKLQHIFEAKNKLGFAEKYTREDNPKVYTKDLVVLQEGATNFSDFPKKIASKHIIISGNNFTDLVGFPEFVSDDDAKRCVLRIDQSYRLTSLKGRSNIR